MIEDIEIGSIVLVKLSTNDTVIGLLEENTNLDIIIKNPFRLKTVYKDESSKPALYLYHWDEMSDCNIVAYNAVHVLYVTTPKDSIRDFYTKQSNLYFSDQPVEEEFNESNLGEIFTALLEKYSSNNSIQ